MPAKGYVNINKERCKGCNLCVISCPANCLALNTSDTNTYGLHYAYLAEPEDCIACQNCAVICPDAAIEVYKTKKKAG
jgi:2-oxoglutarate ferredoxin oxidoreductase subunit delta